MAKAAKRRTVVKKRNPQDTTLRNVRAAKARMTDLIADMLSLADKVRVLEAGWERQRRTVGALDGRMGALEVEVRQLQLQQHAPSEPDGPEQTEID